MAKKKSPPPRARAKTKSMTTIRLDPVDVEALARARSAEGVSSSALIRRGLHVVAAKYYPALSPSGWKAAEPDAESEVSSRGQVVLPRVVRDALGARGGDTIAYEIERDAVRIRRVESLDREFHKALAGTLDEWASEEDDEAFDDL
jgi:bifunctional DNA-binding transcriptional regulator/antitoxin component of YhaV-PrlF toxin-antitoxin module